MLFFVKTAKRAVIIGAGFAGLAAAFALKELSPKTEVIVIDKSDCFTYAPGLYEYAAGEIDEGDLCILCSTALSKRKIVFYRDGVEAVNLKKKIVETTSGEEISFDYLLLAVGAQTNFYNISGMQENALPLKSKEDAERLYVRVQEALQKKKHSFLIVGGGLTGVEYASSLAQHVCRECKKNKVSSKNFSITVLQDKPRLAAELPQKAGKIIEEALRKQDVKIVLNSPATKAGKNFVVAGKKKFFADTIVWAGGVKTHPLLERIGLPISEKWGGRALPGGGLVTNEFLQSIGNKRVFAAGDCSCIPGIAVPKTAANAVAQGVLSARNIAAEISGKNKTAFQPAALHALVSIGKKGVLVENGKVRKGEDIKKFKAEVEKDFLKILQQPKKKTTAAAWF